MSEIEIAFILAIGDKLWDSCPQWLDDRAKGERIKERLDDVIAGYSGEREHDSR